VVVRESGQDDPIDTGRVLEIWAPLPPPPPPPAEAGCP
jgi:hypothetical protein